MKPLDVNYHPDKEYRELFTVEVDCNKYTDDVIGITKDAELLYIKEEMGSHGNAYWTNRTFFSIDKNEFHHYLEIARNNGEIEKAIKNGHTTSEELEELDR